MKIVRTFVFGKYVLVSHAICYLLCEAVDIEVPMREIDFTI